MRIISWRSITVSRCTHSFELAPEFMIGRYHPPAVVASVGGEDPNRRTLSLTGEPTIRGVPLSA